MSENEIIGTTFYQRFELLLQRDPIYRLSRVVSATRPLDEQLAEVSTAAEIWLLCEPDEALAQRWILASGGLVPIVTWGMALGLEPEQISRIVGSESGPRLIDMVGILSDQEILDALASQPAQEQCTCGWEEWEATGEGWTCVHCHVDVRRDPRP
jgi:hypothetical protein